MNERILFVVDRPCLPVVDGFSQRAFSWIRYFNQKRHEIFFLSFNTPGRKWTGESLSLLKDHVADFLIIDDYADAVYRYLKKPVKFAYYLARGHFWSIDFVDRIFTGTIHREIWDYINGSGASIMLVNVVDSVRLVGPDNIRKFQGRKIIDIHDLQADHNQMIKKALERTPLKEFVNGVYSDYLVDKFIFPFFNYPCAREAEIGGLALFDTVLPTSIMEYHVLCDVPRLSGKIRYLSPLMPLKANRPAEDADGNRKYDFTYIGGPMLFNIEAMDHFGKHVLPGIIALKPDVSFLVGGAICRLARKIFGGYRCVEYLDRVHDLEAFYGNARAVVVPLLSGTGVSVKTLEAMSHGCPVISTSVGVRGLEVRDGVDVLIEDEPSRFAERLVRLVGDADERRKLSEGAVRTIGEKYSMARYEDTLHAIFGMTVGDRAPQERIR